MLLQKKRGGGGGEFHYPSSVPSIPKFYGAGDGLWHFHCSFVLEVVIVKSFGENFCSLVCTAIAVPLNIYVGYQATNHTSLYIALHEQ